MLLVLYFECCMINLFLQPKCMNEGDYTMAHIYFLGQNINNVLSSSNQQYSISSAVVPGQLCLTFAFMSQLGLLLHFFTFQGQIWMLSIYGKKEKQNKNTKSTWRVIARRGYQGPVLLIAQGHCSAWIWPKLILELKIILKFYKRQI